MPKITTGISLDIKIFNLAKSTAKKQRRTFSNYVEGLIEVDLGPVITDEPQHTPKTIVKRRVREVL